jgi:hypothetical protein
VQGVEGYKTVANPETADQRVEEKQKTRSKYQRDIDNNHSLLPEKDNETIRSILTLVPINNLKISRWSL